ncbi:MAG: ATP-binding cassette domain-containing protein [Verrucomicrobia bacterium]|jgi:ABC-2 type transport system ATP-binding protein|nr:ATP-binding cassette domain-containing protein [Verrucomicrobiota bacterium]
MPAIEVSGLTKTFQAYQKQPGFTGAIRGLFRRRYDTVHAVRNVSFTIQPGEFVGFVGPNGAGKTTTLKMLSGLLHPTTGTARVLGHIPWERADAYRRQFALLLGQKNQLWWDLPANESFALNARIYGISETDKTRRVTELSELLGVREKLSVQVRELSLGQRMKMELIASLLHQPRVLFLDEPTLGLDVVSQQTVRHFLRDYSRRQQTTILLTSHYMADIEALCQRVIIIDRGALYFDGPLESIVDQFADFKLVTLQCEDAESVNLQTLSRHGEIVEEQPGKLTLKIKRDRVIPACKSLLDELIVKDIDIHEVPIEEVVRQIFSRQNPDAPTTPSKGYPAL